MNGCECDILCYPTKQKKSVLEKIWLKFAYHTNTHTNEINWEFIS